MKKNKIFIRLIGILILLILFLFIDFKLVFLSLSNINLKLVLLAMLLIIPIYVFKSIRWNILLRIKKIKYPIIKTIMVYMASNFIAFITPGRVGEMVKALYIKEYNNTPISSVLPTIIADRIFDVYLLLFASLTGFFNFPLLGNKILLGLFFLFAGITVFTSLLFVKRFYGWLVKILLRFKKLQNHSQKIIEFMDNFHKSAKDLLDSRLILCGILTLLAYFTLFYSTFLLAQSAQIGLGFWRIVFFVSVANCLSFLPVTISGIGTRDAALIFLFSLIGKSNEEAIVFSTLILITLFLVSGLYGFICYMFKPVQWNFKSQRK